MNKNERTFKSLKILLDNKPLEFKKIHELTRDGIENIQVKISGDYTSSKQQELKECIFFYWNFLKKTKKSAFKDLECNLLNFVFYLLMNTPDEVKSINEFYLEEYQKQFEPDFDAKELSPFLLDTLAAKLFELLHSYRTIYRLPGLKETVCSMDC